MGLIKSFFLLPSKGKFLQGFAQNEQLKAQADLVWRHLDDWSLILLGITLLSGVGLAAIYYTKYNEMPGRHYKVSHWVIIGGLSALLSFVITLAIEYFGIRTNLKSGLSALYLMCALNNALYCAIVYILTSFLWCNLFSTNAYKLLKI